jgi:MFS family permease
MRRLLLLISAIVLVDTMFYAAIAPLLPQYSDDLGLSKTAAGILSAAYPAGTLIASLPAGLLAARVGVRPTVLTGLVLLGASSIAFGLGDSVVVLDVARFTQGVGGACAWTGGLAWLLAASPKERRGELIGTALAAAIAGVLLGPVLGGIATVAGPEPVFGSVAVIAVGLGIWASRTPAAAPEPPPSLRAVRTAIFTGPVLIAVWLVALPSLFAGVFDVLAPLRLDELGASGVAIGAIFLGAAAIEALWSRAMGGVSDRHGRMTPIRAGLVAGAIAAALLPLPGTIAMLTVAFVFAVLALGLLWAPAMALLSDRAETVNLDLAFATALVNLAWAGGQVVGGSLGPTIAEASSDGVSYLLVAGLFALTLVALLRRQAGSRVGEHAPAG